MRKTFPSFSINGFWKDCCIHFSRHLSSHQQLHQQLFLKVLQKNSFPLHFWYCYFFSHYTATWNRRPYRPITLIKLFSSATFMWVLNALCHYSSCTEILLEDCHLISLYCTFWEMPMLSLSSCGLSHITVFPQLSTRPGNWMWMFS